MTIQRKFHVLMGIVIVALGVMIWLTSSSARTLVGLERQAVMIAKVEAGMLTLRRNEKDFLARNQPKYVEQFDANLQTLEAQIEDLSNRLAASGIDESHIRELGVLLHDYGARFTELAALQRVIGLSPKEGLYGSLREAVHQVESVVKQQKDYRLLSDMLTLRRNEKDFMLREDPKYIDKLVKNAGVFEQHLAASAIPADQQAQIAVLLDKYRTDFLALADAYKRRGLTADQGLHGALRDTVHSSEELLRRIDNQVVGAVDAHIVNARIWAFATGTGILVTVVAVLFWLCRSITGPVNRLAAIMREAAQQRDLTLRADEGAGGELGQMAGAFNFMMGELQVLIERLRQSAALVGTASRQLAEVTTTAARGVELQRTESDQVATAMNEMAATVQEVARHAVDAASASSEADGEAGQGTRVVGQTVEGISRLAREVEQTADTIQALEKESTNIGTVLSVITGIAEQTNLLALNAAIEAARAGEQGRGFAVVADEVRTLAQRSQRSTEEIKTIIDRLQAKAQDAVKAMGSGRTQAGQSVEQAQQAGASLTAIAQAITTIRDMNTQIAGAAEEQSAVADEINRSVVRIAQVAEESAVGVEQITRTSDELAGLAEDLQARVNVFRLGAVADED